MREKDERVLDEIDRLNGILTEGHVSKARIKALQTIVHNTAFMKIKLDDTREKIGESSVAIPYDNGGGQKGIRENPLFKGYESLWKSYLTGLTHIMSALPPEVAKADIDTAEKPKTVLEMVQNRHKKQA